MSIPNFENFVADEKTIRPETEGSQRYNQLDQTGALTSVRQAYQSNEPIIERPEPDPELQEELPVQET